MALEYFSRRNFIKFTTLTGLATTQMACVSTQLTGVSQNEKGLKFLFQGDSITDGNRGRDSDPNHILGHGYCFSVASKIGVDFPERNFQFFNRGISGNTISDLEKRWQQDTLDLRPDVLSLLIGINDVNALINGNKDTDIQTFETTYRKLLTSCRNQNTNMLFLLGLPFFVATGWRKNQYENWHRPTLERAEIVRRIAGEFNAVVLDYPMLFDKAQRQAPLDYWIWDGIHPTVFGHEIMAREWLRQASTQLHFLKPYIK